MRVKSMASLTIVCLITCLANFALLGGQTMPKIVERLLKFKDFIALESDEIPNFKTKGAIAFHPAGQKDHLIWVQGLTRQIPDFPGKERTDIIIRLFPHPDPETAYKYAIFLTWSQRIYPDGAGMPQGSWTGLPIGEKSWATAPDPEAKPAPGLGTANLVVWDDRLAMRVIIKYQPIGGPKAKTAIFLPIGREDLEWGDLAARIILTKANMVLLGWNELPKVRLVIEGKAMEGRGDRNGRVFVPVRAMMGAIGGKLERRKGIVKANWGGREVIMPIGAREMLVGQRRVKLSLPILWDGEEVWVEGAGIAKGFGMALRWERGEVVVLAKR